MQTDRRQNKKEVVHLIYCVGKGIGSTNLPTIVYDTVNGWLLLLWKYKLDPEKSSVSNRLPSKP